jgi:peptidoglycan hydrolase CwlO-like protein
MKKSDTEVKQRKTLIELTNETTVRDPAAHAKLQVVELDKTAQRSMEKRKKCHDQIESDKAEIEQLEHQIAMLKTRLFHIYSI